MAVMQDTNRIYYRTTISLPPELQAKIARQRKAPRRINVSQVCAEALEKAFAKEEAEQQVLAILLSEQ
jgi:Arc/MetJ-type ribon-helix-helix transcriptional regulator